MGWLGFVRCGLRGWSEVDIIQIVSEITKVKGWDAEVV